jgi:hypothetical protein
MTIWPVVYQFGGRPLIELRLLFRGLISKP